jgi:hypothetical protein
MRIERVVKARAQPRASPTSRHCARQSGYRCRIVGQSVRSGGSTFWVTRGSSGQVAPVETKRPPRRAGAERPAGGSLEPAGTQ